MKTFFFMIACWIAGLPATAADPEITVPLRERGPVVDGVIGEDEWRDSVALSGFLLTKPMGCVAASGGEGIVHFACEGRTLYLALRFAARNNDPGGGLAARASSRDGTVTEDDNIEFVLKTDADPDQIYHIFVNPRDVVFDRLWPVGRKADTDWNCPGFNAKSVVKAKVWECEIAIPLSSIGNPQDRVLVNIARNSPGEGSARLVPTSDYQKGSKLVVRWAKDAPAIHMLPLGNPLDGKWSTGVRIAAAKMNAKYDVSLTINTKYKPEVEGVRVAEKTETLGAGESLKLDFSTLSRDNFLCYAVKVADAEGRTLLDRSMIAKRGRQSRGIPMTGEYDLGDVATAVVYHYPGLGKARITVFPASGHRVEGVQVGSEGRLAAAEHRADGSFSVLVDASGPVGKFALDVVAQADGEVRRFSRAIELERKRFEWLDNRIGTEEVILPPFTPITAKGDSFEVLLRKCRLNASALPVQVNALGRDILADEAYYEIAADGGLAERFTGKTPRIEGKKGGYKAEAEGEAKTLSGIVLKTDCEIEYDGFQKNEVKLEGVTERMVDRLTLVIPFRSVEVPLYHICTADSIRFNPTGALPSGEGLLWDGTMLYRKSEFLDPMMEPQTVPYIWLGAERRGLSWCINNTCGFKLDAEKPSVRIVREKGVVRVEIDIINRPVRLKDGHSFAFAFEATPVKMPDRGLMRQFPAAVGGVPEGFVCRKSIDWITLGYFNMWAHGPADGNWDAYSAVCRRVKEGSAYPGFFADMTNCWERLEPMREKYASTMQNMGKSSYHRWMKSCWRGNVRYFETIPPGSYTMEYSDPTLAWNGDPFVEDFKSEWISRGTGYIGAVRTFLVPSLVDYLLWYHREQLKHGLFGIYMDDMFPMTCRNPDTSMKRDDEGKWHGNFGIFEMRDLVKRVSVLQHEMGAKPRLLQVHMTNCLLVPCFAFATSTLSWEDHYGEDEFQKRYPLDYIRAESLGTQVGCEAIALDGIYRGTWDEKDWRYGRFSFLTRTQLALLLPIGVKVSRRPQMAFAGYDAETLYPVYGVLGRFRIWEDDCRFVPCFEDDGAVGGIPEGVLVASWRRTGETLVVFSNLDGKDKSFTPLLDRAALGLSASAKSYDAEGDDPLPDGRVRLPGWDFALVRYSESVPAPTGELLDLSSGWTTNASYKTGLARYHAKGVSANPGDTVRLILRVKGKGAWKAGIYQYQDRRNGVWKGDVLAQRIARSSERSRKETVEVRVADDVQIIRPVVIVMDGADVAFEEMRMEIVRKDLK